MPTRIDPCSPLEARDVEAWYAETDVLVIGYGGAGSCAALEAQALGVDVTLLEIASAGGRPRGPSCRHRRSRFRGA